MALGWGSRLKTVNSQDHRGRRKSCEERLPSMLCEYDHVARHCAVEQVDYQLYLLRMTELELLDRERRAIDRRIRQATFML